MCVCVCVCVDVCAVYLLYICFFCVCVLYASMCVLYVWCVLFYTPFLCMKSVSGYRFLFLSFFSCSVGFFCFLWKKIKEAPCLSLLLLFALCFHPMFPVLFCFLCCHRVAFLNSAVSFWDIFMTISSLLSAWSENLWDSVRFAVQDFSFCSMHWK